jgi:hypothetical protein
MRTVLFDSTAYPLLIMTLYKQQLLTGQSLKWNPMKMNREGKEQTEEKAWGEREERAGSQVHRMKTTREKRAVQDSLQQMVLKM